MRGRGDVPPGVRLGIAVTVAMLAAHYVYFLASTVAFHRDMAQMWFAAREVLHGRSPYESIGPGRAFDWPWPLYYPLPTVLLAVPLAPMPEPVAMAVFAALSMGAFAWAMSSKGYPGLLSLASFTTWHAVTLVQWSPLLAAAAVLPALSLLVVAKPTVGAALFTWRPTWWPVIGAVVLTVAAFVIQPGWVHDWVVALNSPNVKPGYHAGHFAIIQFVGGPLLLLALLRWRRPEARLLAVLACVPQTLLPYEAVLLFLIPRGWLESIALTILSYVMFFVAIRGGPANFAVRTLTFGPAVTLTMYLPCLLMVLRRPNEGRAPAFVERWISAWPRWIRGEEPRSRASYEDGDVFDATMSR